MIVFPTRFSLGETWLLDWGCQWFGGRAPNIRFFYDNFSFLWSINFKLGGWVGHIKIQVGIDLGVNLTVKFQNLWGWLNIHFLVKRVKIKGLINMGVMICFSQGGLRSQRASSSYMLFPVQCNLYGRWRLDGLNLNKQKVVDEKPG